MGAVYKRQVIDLRNCCIWLVDSVESMMMHGLANPRPSFTLLTFCCSVEWRNYVLCMKSRKKIN